MSEHTPDVIRWRDERGRVVSGYVIGHDVEGRRWEVAIPDWIAGELTRVWVADADAVLGNVPWPPDR